MGVPEQEREQYEAYVRHLRKAEGELEHLEQRVAALRKIVEGFRELHPELGTKHESSSREARLPDARPVRRIARKSPTGKKAVALVLQEADDLLTIADIMEQLEASGTAPASEEALRTTLNRMFKNDGTVEKGEKNSRLAYRWKD